MFIQKYNALLPKQGDAYVSCVNFFHTALLFFRRMPSQVAVLCCTILLLEMGTTDLCVQCCTWSLELNVIKISSAMKQAALLELP